MGWFDSGTRMRQLGNQGDYSVAALGDRLYLFTPRIATNRAIISAHGGHHLVSNVNQFPTPPGVTLHFYAPDQVNLQDPGLDAFSRMRVNAQPVETLPPRSPCFNYILTKYQTAPGPGAESYDSIQAILGNEVAALQRVLDRRARFEAAGHAVMARAMREQEKMYPMAAVITVRNRRFASDMTLEELLLTVRGQAPQLTDFDCLFCRGHFWSNAAAVQYGAPLANGA